MLKLSTSQLLTKNALNNEVHISKIYSKGRKL
jgi:hypothetical protein